jgi:hypothetical protein
MLRGEANFKAGAKGLAWPWSRIVQTDYNFTTAASADVESSSGNARNALETDDLLGHRRLWHGAC